jgi:hypothetical protein
VFDYVIDGEARAVVADEGVMDAALGAEPAVRWLNGLGFPRADWENGFPPGTALSADDAVYPEELRSHVFFRRRGSKLTDGLPRDSGGQVLLGTFVRGDFDTMRQLVVEHDATAPGQEAVRSALGRNPVLSVLVQSHSYLVARYGFDGFRIDTVKYVHPQMIEYFGNAMREFALSIGKKNFFTFAEVYDDEAAIAGFVGRNTSESGSFGVDAALDFPLFYKLPAVAKGMAPVETLRGVFEDRKAAEKELLSTHGEAGRYFVSFLGNHDQKQRFNHPASNPAQITLGYALMFGLQGIPSVYYGDEQGLDGTKDANGNPDLTANESSREALWGRPGGFDTNAPIYLAIWDLSRCRREHPALRARAAVLPRGLGERARLRSVRRPRRRRRLQPHPLDAEVLVVHTHTTERFTGSCSWTRTSRQPRRMSVRFSNRGTQGDSTVRLVPAGGSSVGKR